MSDVLEEQRREKLERLRALGVAPYGARLDGAVPLAELVGRFEALEGRAVLGAGRIGAMRSFGKAAFLDLRDRTGKVQVFARRQALSERDFALLGLLDVGDWLAARGPLQRTKTGEISIFAESLTLLSKSLLPPPEKWHGLRDVEARYRRRWVDLASNPEVLEDFRARTEVLRAIRRCLDERGFLEVETPMMQTLPGGAAARPFVTHHNALDMDLYLRVSPELFLKKLLVGGMERVYEINRNFRNEGISTRHNPEFTMLEAYQAYADYEGMMDLCEAILGAALEALPEGRRPAILVENPPPWPRRTYADLLREHGGPALDDEAGLLAKAREQRLEGLAGLPPAAVADKLFKALVEPHLTGPVFVLDYPLALCPLAKESAERPGIAERFELYVNSMELANAYSELNDPLEQERRFREQIDTGEGEVRVADESFLDALKCGMPPAGGLGIGIDRLMMVLLGRPSIRDVILFPLLRERKDEHV